MTRRHACPTCHAMHTAPKASNLLNAVMRCIAFTAIEVAAALALDGWLALGLWVIAAWNVVLLILLVIGMAQASTKLADRDRDATQAHLLATSRRIHAYLDDAYGACDHGHNYQTGDPYRVCDDLARALVNAPTTEPEEGNDD